MSEIKEHLDKECLKSTECIIERTGDFCEALATNNKGSARARVVSNRYDNSKENAIVINNCFISVCIV